jgi:phosphatidylglycerol---prolipoprotein diacylglyceryl transferase
MSDWERLSSSFDGQRSAYSSFMLLSLAVFLVARRFMPRPGSLALLPWWKRALITLAGFIGGSLGGKLPFVFSSADGALTWTAWLSDGKTITVALIGAYVAVELAKSLLDVTVKTGDGFAIPLALALAVGRLGCFCNGCCAGVETSLPWSVDFGDGVCRHPTQIYESLFHLGMAALLWGLLRSERFRYQLLKLYLIAYGVYRLCTEMIRPEPRDWWGLTFYQVVSVLLVAGLSLQWLVDERRKRRERSSEPRPMSAASVEPTM